jgi:SRSO17 transposase
MEIIPGSVPGGDNPNFLAGLEQRRRRYAAAVRADFAVASSRIAKAPRADALLAGLPRSSWRTVRWREGSAGWLRGRFAAVRRGRVTSEGRRRLGRPIGERPGRGQTGKAKYHRSDFGPDAALLRMVESAHRRHWVEQFHEESKGLLGWDQYQGRLWPGFHRHAVSVMLAYSFLVRHEQRRRGRTRRPFSPSAGPAPGDASGGASPCGRLAPVRGAA